MVCGASRLRSHVHQYEIGMNSLHAHIKRECGLNIFSNGCTWGNSAVVPNKRRAFNMPYKQHGNPRIRIEATSMSTVYSQCAASLTAGLSPTRAETLSTATPILVYVVQATQQNSIMYTLMCVCKNFVCATEAMNC